MRCLISSIESIELTPTLALEAAASGEGADSAAAREQPLIVAVDS